MIILVVVLDPSTFLINGSVDVVSGGTLSILNSAGYINGNLTVGSNSTLNLINASMTAINGTLRSSWGLRIMDWIS